MLEKGDNTSNFIEFIYKQGAAQLLNWMKSNSSDRFPSNTSVDVIDYMSNDSFFISFNLIIYIMYTVGYYFLFFFGFTLFSLDYVNNNLTSWLGKLNKVYSAEGTVLFITWLVRNIISVNKILLIFLFTILLVCSTLLYIYYNISSDLDNHFYNNIKDLYNGETIVYFHYKYYGVSVEILQKASLALMSFGIAIYRTSLILQLFKGYPFIQLPLGLGIVHIIRNINNYIMDIVAVENYTFIQMLDVYNICSKLVFYSLIVIVISITILYIIPVVGIKKNGFISEILCPIKYSIFIGTDEKKVYSSNYDKYLYLFFNIVIFLLKMVVSVAFIVAFQGIVYLSTHYISSDLLHLYS